MKCVGGKEKLAPPQGFRFAVVRSEEKLSVGLPGGFVFVSTGLLKDLKTEDELAGVLSHEATHIVCQDGADAPFETFLKAPYSRVQEKIADRGALLSGYRGGYFPADYIQFVEDMKNEASSRHPASPDRVTWLKRDFVKMQKKGIVNTQKARAARFSEFKKITGS